MTIDEAIRVLESEVKCWRLHPEEIYPKAYQLGIEALSAIKCGREGLRTEFFTPLIGETESETIC